jgi:hypothetical protein
VQEAKAGASASPRTRARLVDQAVRAQGIEVIYHASFCDAEALDMLEQHKIEHFIAPGLAWLINTCHTRSE